MTNETKSLPRECFSLLSVHSTHNIQIEMFFLTVDTLFMARSFPIWLMSRDLSFTVLQCVMDFLTAISIDYNIARGQNAIFNLVLVSSVLLLFIGRDMEDCFKRHGEILINL